MKKKLLALLLIGILMISCSCRKATLEDYKLFRSTPMGFSMEYPDFWQKTVNNKEKIAAFVTPSEGYSDQYRDAVSVQYFALDMAGENAYNEYVKGYVADLEATLKNYRLVSENSIQLDGAEAYRIVYESSSDDESDQKRFMQIFCERGEQVYVVSYIAEFKSYAYFLTYVEKMLSTFRWL